MSSSSDFFSVQLSATSNAAANIPALQWHCRHPLRDPFCTQIVESLHCRRSIFAHASDFQAYLYDLRQAEDRQQPGDETSLLCHEIFVQDGSSIFSSSSLDGNNTCTTSATATNDHETMLCPAVFYRISNGQNQYATCPVGSLLVVHAVGLQADFQRYIFAMNATRVQLVDNGNIPLECEVMQQQEELISYICASASVTFQFASLEEDSTLTLSRIPDSTPRDVVGYCDDKCHGIPSPTPAEPPSDDEDEDEFSVQVESTDNFAHLPVMEWTCRLAGYDDCWVAPWLGNSTTTSCMEHVVNTTPMDLDLLDLQDNVCHKIVVNNASCPQVVYRQNGRVGPSAPIPKATCPVGSIMQVSASLPTTATELVLVPAAYNLMLLPDGCVYLADTIQCNVAAATTISLTFAYGRRSWPLSGSLYGSCPVGNDDNNETLLVCLNGTHVQDILPPPTLAPTQLPTYLPTTSSPTFGPTPPRPTTNAFRPWTAVPTTLQPTQGPSSSSSTSNLSSLDAWLFWVSLLIGFWNLQRP